MEFQNIDTPQKLLAFMSENISYGFKDESGNIHSNPSSNDWKDYGNKYIVQTGEEVLYTKVGTCWDKVELERIWFEKKGYEFKTIFIWFELNSEQNNPTHTFLLFQEKNKWYWFENAFEAYRGIHEFNSFKDALNFVIDKHSEYSVNSGFTKPEDKKFIEAYEYNKLSESISANNYLRHATNYKINKTKTI